MADTVDIHKACRTGNKLVLERILSQDVANINRRNKESRTPVMEAAVQGFGDIYDYLVSKGCDLSQHDSENNTLLHIACMGGSNHIVSDLLARDVHSINDRGYHGKTPVMNAAERGHREVFFLLLEKECVLSIADRFRRDILHWSCWGGSVAIVEFLLSQDTADVDVKDCYGLTPAMTAARLGHRPAFDMLVSRGCDLSIVDSDSRNILHHACFGGSHEMVEYLLTKGNIDINGRNRNGVTPVKIAVFKGHVNIFFLLVSIGCDLTGVDNIFGETILHEASKGGSVEIVHYLLLQGNADMNSGGRYGATPAMIAAQKCMRDVFELLVNNGCDLRVKDDHGDTVLHHASRSGCVEIIELITNTDNINEKGRYDLTPIMIAAKMAHRDVFYLLVAKGCTLRGVSTLGDTILHCACIGGSVNIVKYILSRKIVDINSRGQNGRTPVMLAALKAKDEVFSILVDSDCDLTVMDKNNANLLHHACAGGSVEIVSYLVSGDNIYINSRGQAGWTPVMIAACNGHIDVYNLLVEANCDTSLVSDSKLGVFHIVCVNGIVDLAEKWLMSDVRVTSLRGGEKDRTPLMMAACKGHKLVYDMCLRKGCDLKVKDRHKNNILHLACMGGNVNIVDDILSHNVVDINSRGDKGRTGAMMAAENGHTEAFNFLVKSGCGLSGVDDANNNIFHSACVGGSIEIVEFMLSQKIVDINVSSGLKLAAEKGHTTIVELLRHRNTKNNVSFARQPTMKTPKEVHID